MAPCPKVTWNLILNPGRPALSLLWKAVWRTLRSQPPGTGQVVPLNEPRGLALSDSFRAHQEILGARGDAQEGPASSS